MKTWAKSRVRGAKKAALGTSGARALWPELSRQVKNFNVSRGAKK
jgi:hypothetical protein